MVIDIVSVTVLSRLLVAIIDRGDSRIVESIFVMVMFTVAIPPPSKVKVCDSNDTPKALLRFESSICSEIVSCKSPRFATSILTTAGSVAPTTAQLADEVTEMAILGNTCNVRGYDTLDPPPWKKIETA